MKKFILWAVLILSVAGCSPGIPTPTLPPTAPPTPTPTPEPLELVVLHTNDTWGYVFPCG